MKTRMWMILILGLMLLALGCTDAIRFAPSEAQKQNAYLLGETTRQAALTAKTEESSADLQTLTALAHEQSKPVLLYTGLPKTLPAANTAEELTSAENQQITGNAAIAAKERPDPWTLADNLLELGLGLAGLVGGVYGTKAVAALTTARQKAQALKEIVQNNELFLEQNAVATEAFKAAQAKQSAETKVLVTEIKSQS